MRWLLWACLVCVSGAAARSVEAQVTDDWEVKRDPFDKATVARYKAVLNRNPHDRGALSALMRLYGKYRSVAQLKNEYAAQTGPALIVRGRLALAERDQAAARIAFTAAAALRATDGELWHALGTLEADASNVAAAIKAFEQAVTHGNTATQKAALVALTDLAAANGDLALAEKTFARRRALEPKNPNLTVEWGDTLARASRWAEAESAFRQADAAVRGDPVRRAEIAARLGDTLEGQSKPREAADAYERGLGLVPRDHVVTRDLLLRLVDVERKQQALEQLLTRLEQRFTTKGRTYFEWSTLALLYEETGNTTRAIAAYRAALAKAPWEIDTHRRLIAMLDASGQADAALAQFESVAKSMPGDAPLQLELAERYVKRNNKPKAHAVWKRVLAGFPNEPSVLSALADAYQRIGDEASAKTMYERLVKVSPDDPMHLVQLGEYYYGIGDARTAQATWAKIAAKKSAEAHARLAEVYADHRMIAEAREQWRLALALAPTAGPLHRRHGSFLESLREFSTALAAYQTALTVTPATDRAPRRELRGDIVNLVARQNQIPIVGKWETQWQRGRGDLEAGLLLAEYYGRKQDTRAQLAMYEVLYAKAPADADVTNGLVRACREAGDFARAVQVLMAVAAADPAKERETFAEIAEIKSLARDDAAAIEWSLKALAKSPTDPTAHVRLSERYVELQRFGEARAALTRASELDPGNFGVLLTLARLTAQAGQLDQALEIYRRILVGATDPAVLEPAGREALSYGEVENGLALLESALLPLVRNGAPLPIYKILLLDVYARWIPRLARDTSAATELRGVAGRSLSLLLEALQTGEWQGQAQTIALLEQLGARAAAPALVQFALGEAQKPAAPDSVAVRELIAAALVAAGRLGGSEPTRELLELSRQSDWVIADAATFAFAMRGHESSTAELIARTTASREQSQILGCLGLAFTKGGAVAITQVLRHSENDVVRAACAFAAGRRGDRQFVPALESVVQSSQGESQRLAAWALGIIASPTSAAPLVKAYVGSTSDDRSVLVWALGRLAGAGPASMPSLGGHGQLQLTPLIATLPGPLPATNVTLAPPLAAAIRSALGPMDARCHTIVIGSVRIPYSDSGADCPL